MGPQIARVFRILRVSRLIKLVKSFEEMQNLIQTLILFTFFNKCWNITVASLFYLCNFGMFLF